MVGLDSLDSRTAEAINAMLGMVYPANLYDMGRLEDMVLATAERDRFSPIGTDNMKMSVALYMADNIYWTSVCLFVNEDFRECFHDAILIEKALLQVTETEYADFRDDMVLATDADVMGEKIATVRLDRYANGVDMAFRSRIKSAKQRFFDAGMMDAYDELLATFRPEIQEDISYIIHNMLYMLNAMDKNGVFRKYVHLVVDSVREQLSADT